MIGPSNSKSGFGKASKPSITPRVLACSLLALFFFSGCDRNDTAIATQRKPAAEVVFHDPGSRAPDSASEQSNATDLANLHSERFDATLVLNVKKIAEHRDLADVPWQQVESLVSQWVDPDHGKITNLKKVAFLISLDAGNLMSMASSSSTLPGVTVLEFDSDIPVDSVKKKEGRTFSRIVENRFLLIGKKSDIGSIEFVQSQRSAFIRKELRNGRMLAGWLSFDRLRPQLQAMFGFVKGIPGMDIGKLANFPQTASHLSFWLSLDGESAADLQLFVDDGDITKELSRLFGEAVEQAQAASFPGDGAGSLKSMVDSKSAEPGASMLQEIRDENLLRILAESDRLHVQLASPKGLSEFTVAAVDDMIVQFAVSDRANKFSQIATALRKKAKQDDGLDELAKLSASSRKSGQPFNWRVAILPELGQQELYEAFDFSLAWDDPKNLKAAQRANPFVHQEDSNATSICWLQTEGDSDHGLRVAECGQAQQQPWTKPCEPFNMADANAETLGRAGENGFLAITNEHKLRALSKENYDQDVFCPGVQPPRSKLNFGF